MRYYSALLITVLLAGCELFTGPKIDLLQKIDDEIDWANAEKLTVRIEYPAVWGASNPSAGTITPVTDIRKGYPFDVEFTPTLEYNLKGWRAYATASLPEGWQQDPAYYLEEQEKIAETGGVSIPQLPARGGTGSFTIDTSVPVTLIPWCLAEPYIIRTEPADGPGEYYPATADIILYFNAALNPETVRFGEEHITIRAKSIDAGDEEYEDISDSYDAPEYAYKGGSHMVTIKLKSVGGAAPIGCQIAVTAGAGIENLEGKGIAAETFSWRTPRPVEGHFTGWSADYNQYASSIQVRWQITHGGIPPQVVVRYRIDQGEYNTFEENEYGLWDTPDGIQFSVIRADASLIQQGEQISGLHEYEITLDLYADSMVIDTRRFRIWNIPGIMLDFYTSAFQGMEISSDDNSVIEIGSSEQWVELCQQKAVTSGKKYFLTSDIIVVGGTWLGDASGEFCGEFYGNGHTINIWAVPMIDAGNNIGLFGVARNALIRDLTVAYSVTPSSPITGTPSMGGIVGEARGSNSSVFTLIANCIVKGVTDTSGLAVNAHTNINLGGIVGGSSGSVVINNCLSSLNIECTASGTNDVYLGGIVGVSGGNTFGDNPIMSAITVTGNLSLNQDTGTAYMGGVAGAIWNTSSPCRDLEFSGILTKTGAGGKIGGIAGDYSRDNTLSTTIFSNCRVSGSINVSDNSSGGSLFIGGLLNGEGGIAGIALEDSWASGDITVSRTGSGELYCGGIMSQSSYSSVTNCRYERGSITVSGGTGDIYLGGGFGGTSSSTLENCYSRASLVSASPAAGSQAQINIGGLAGSASGQKIERCYAQTDVSASGYEVCAGGLVGDLTNSSISNSYALGNVSVNGGSAGGLVGTVTSPVSNSLQYCFSGGTVSSTLYTGGIVGYISNPANNFLNHNAAIGAGVTATGSTPYAGRIYGHATGSFTTAGNYARDDMRIEKSDSSSTLYYPYWDGTGTEPPLPYYMFAPGNSAATGNNGASVSASAFRNTNTWSNVLGFNSNVWNFSTVTSRGHPILRNVGGQ